MNPGWYVTASDIKNWAETKKRDSSAMLPLLIMKLIYASCRPKQIHFPSKDSISTSDYDGVVEVEEGNEFVPYGDSVWEISTEKNVRNKMEMDYKKRTRTPRLSDISKTSIVFVTPRTWSKRRIWCNNKNKEMVWKKVYGLNADDLENWLHNCPAVHRWFANILGKRTYSVIDTEQVLDKWTNETSIKLTEYFILSEREKQIRELKNLLAINASRIHITAPSKNEAIVFCATVIRSNDSLNNRALFVNTQHEWDSLIELKYSLILIINEDFLPNNIGQAISNGHHVILTIAQTETINRNTGIVLQRLSHDGSINMMKMYYLQYF